MDRVNSELKYSLTNLEFLQRSHELTDRMQQYLSASKQEDPITLYPTIYFYSEVPVMLSRTVSDGIV